MGFATKMHVTHRERVGLITQKTHVLIDAGWFRHRSDHPV